ncbi:CheB methylesterase domain-containing protein [Oceanibacterium hippocampi]|uniref:protein-glutamate methylesterase n=1 Tax=Oceanibacterium hippocampi TaxID=745714 RepID=A0A1Y5TQR4_9PROT|nr:CheB methylesterase domain-containing protein [Oceanibacterium hippocampi]SLN69669.1 Chemotaxis response regulator protein-glutamate methylesterase [Oceanibacterium hippocampi]
MHPDIEQPADASPIRLRPVSRLRPQAIAVGCSTGGPQALQAFLEALRPPLDLPVFVVQHMPATFTAILAAQLARECGADCHEGQDGEPVGAGRIYIAPGGHHMSVERRGDAEPVIRIHRQAPVNFCRPSVDVLLDGLAKVYDCRVLTVMLSGTGEDGLAGVRAVVAGGGMAVAQDAGTSVAWGMPGAVARAGLCTAVLPPGEIGARVRGLVAGSAA